MYSYYRWSATSFTAIFLKKNLINYLQTFKNTIIYTYIYIYFVFSLWGALASLLMSHHWSIVLNRDQDKCEADNLPVDIRWWYDDNYVWVMTERMRLQWKWVFLKRWLGSFRNRMRSSFIWDGLSRPTTPLHWKDLGKVVWTSDASWVPLEWGWPNVH